MLFAYLSDSDSVDVTSVYEGVPPSAGGSRVRGKKV